jgi:hypothetical protein
MTNLPPLKRRLTLNRKIMKFIRKVTTEVSELPYVQDTVVKQIELLRQETRQAEGRRNRDPEVEDPEEGPRSSKLRLVSERLDVTPV